jgi:hypothetical protein
MSYFLKSIDECSNEEFVENCREAAYKRHAT